MSGEPYSRVTENSGGTGSVWQDNDQFYVAFDGVDKIGTYTYNGSAWISSVPLYWQSTLPATVTAWYPATETINLADQSNGLAYVLKAEATADFNSTVSLDFSHQLAKVRVVPSDVANIESMEIYSYTTLTQDQGDVGGADRGWIMMRYDSDNGYYEANVVPDAWIERIRINGTTESAFLPITPQAGNLHQVSITVYKL